MWFVRNKLHFVRNPSKTVREICYTQQRKICQKTLLLDIPGGYRYMTRSQMIETVARKTGFTEAQVETTMDAMFDQIADCLRADEKVTIAGFVPASPRPTPTPRPRFPAVWSPPPSPASRPAAASSRSWKPARRAWKRPPDFLHTENRTRAPGCGSFCFSADKRGISCYTGFRI